MTTPAKITTGVAAALIIAAGALVGGLVLLVTTHERKITASEEWEA